MSLYEQLFRDYCYYRDKTDNVRLLKTRVPYLKPLKPTRERLQLFDELVHWCASKNIPVRQWLYTLFVMRYWKFAPKLEISHLCSEKHIPRFYKVTDYSFFNEYTGVTNPSTIQFDANKDIVSSVEQRKRELLVKGGSQLCMQYMKEETFGFHPKSIICNHCDGRHTCYAELTKLVGQKIIELRNSVNE
jgi:hypothetical protein